MTRIIANCLIVLFVAQIQAQEKTAQFHLGLETGFNVFTGQTNKPDMIRENRSLYNYYKNYDNYDDYGDYGYIYDFQNVFFTHFGVKPEFRLSKYNRFTGAMGIRYSMSISTLNSDGSYFFWKINETETSANYVRIKSITKKNHYIGIPLEIRFFPRKKESFVRHYFVFGKSFNFLIASENDISFVDIEMGKYTSNVKEYLEKPRLFQGNISAGVGLKIGKTNRPHIRVEFYLPAVAYGKGKINSFSKSSVLAGMGMFASLQIPILYSKEQSTITY